MEAKKQVLKLSKSKLNTSSLENLYYSYIDKKIELSLKAIVEGKTLSLQELRKEVAMWK